MKKWNIIALSVTTAVLTFTTVFMLHAFRRDEPVAACEGVDTVVTDSVDESSEGVESGGVGADDTVVAEETDTADTTEVGYSVVLLNDDDTDTPAETQDCVFDDVGFVEETDNTQESTHEESVDGYRFNDEWQVVRDSESGLYSVVNRKGERYLDIEFDSAVVCHCNKRCARFYRDNGRDMYNIYYYSAINEFDQLPPNTPITSFRGERVFHGMSMTVMEAFIYETGELKKRLDYVEAALGVILELSRDSESAIAELPWHPSTLEQDKSALLEVFKKGVTVDTVISSISSSALPGVEISVELSNGEKHGVSVYISNYGSFIQFSGFWTDALGKHHPSEYGGFAFEMCYMVY
jgi:hypothetical protein